MTHDVSKSDLQLNLARKIVELYRERPSDMGDHLREVELSERFEVSRTPIRAALSLLEKSKLVEKRANRGFFWVGEQKSCETFLNNLPRTDDEKICELIAKDWFEGNITKEVSEGLIRERYGLGRLTTQRILNLLSDDGVITRMPGYGWQFEATLNSAGAHDESYEYRIYLETSAILSEGFVYNQSLGERFLARHHSVLKQKESAWNMAEMFRLDAEFHQFLAECSGNRFIVQSISQQNRLRRLLEYNSLFDTHRVAESCSEHIGILDSLEAGDVKRAAELMRFHLQKAKDAGPDFAQAK